MSKYAYKIISVAVDGKSDAAAVSDAGRVIDNYAANGWRLHTYSYVAAGAGGFAKGFAGKDHTNILHLVFEQETEKSKPREKEIIVIRDEGKKEDAPPPVKRDPTRLAG